MSITELEVEKYKRFKKRTQMKRKGENLGKIPKITDHFPKMDTEAMKSKSLKLKVVSEEMSASSSKYEKFDSAVDNLISIIRRSFFGKPIDDELLSELSILMEDKKTAAVGYIISIVERSHFEKPVDDEFLIHLKSLIENKLIAAVDDIISVVRSSHLDKPVDSLFLHDLRSLMENKMIDADILKPAKPVESILNIELDRLPVPNEILVKIFGYLDIQDISRCAQISRQLNMISKDATLWQSWGKLSILKCHNFQPELRKVPTEFLTYIIQRGITELSLFKCEITSQSQDGRIKTAFKFEEPNP